MVVAIFLGYCEVMIRCSQLLAFCLAEFPDKVIRTIAVCLLVKQETRSIVLARTLFKLLHLSLSGKGEENQEDCDHNRLYSISKVIIE